MSNTVLFDCIANQDLEGLKTALQLGQQSGNAADIVEARNSTGSTPLHYAARICWSAGVETLTQHGASVLARTPAGDTPLLLAAYKGLDIPAVQALIAAGADVNVLGDCGNRPLHLAASADHAEVVNVLLVMGAAVEVTNDYGNTPEQLAKSTSIKDILRRMSTPDGRSDLQLQLKLHLEQLMAGRAAERQQQAQEQQEAEARRAAAEQRRQEEDAAEDRLEEAARAAAAAAADAAARAQEERLQAEEKEKTAAEEAAKEAAKAAKKAKAAAKKK